MNVSLWRTLRSYTKSKGILPLDERQMDTMKSLYMELAKSTILGFMIFVIYYGYMDMYKGDTSISFFALGTALIGTITYYYTLRFCYLGVIGFDSNFESVLAPAFLFTPMMLVNVITFLLQVCIPDLSITLSLYGFIYLFAIAFTYWGADRVYRKGRLQQEKELHNGEIQFRSRKQLVNYAIIISIFVAILPLSYDEVFLFYLSMASLFILASIFYYGFMNPNNVYILNEEGLTYHKALWNKTGGFIAFEEIESISQQDTFNLGYAKDKVKIVCKSGKNIYLFPENAYQFCVEIRNNL